MPCGIFSGSCSLCPWCGENACPYHNDVFKKEKRFWLYAVDRENSELIVQGKYDTREEVVARINKLVNREWPKKYRVAMDIDTSKPIKRGSYEVTRVYVPYVQLEITDGEDNWNKQINLLLNTETKELSYYDRQKTKFYAYVDRGEERHIELGKKWNGKIVFKKSK